MASDTDQFDKTNEGKCCDAIVRLLERREGVTRDPNKMTTNAKAGNSSQNVELRLTLGSQDFAIEHTRIMGFNDTAVHRQFVEIRERIKTEALNARGIYILCLDMSSVPRGLSRDEAGLQALERWAHQAAAELDSLSRTMPHKEQRLEKAGTPWGAQAKVKLVRESWSSQSVGVLDVRQVLQASASTDLHQKVVKAIEDKFPKLQSHKDTGASSILILEMLGSNINHHSILDQLPGILRLRTDLPDEIFIIDSLTSKWFVIPVKQGDHYPEFPGQEAIKLNPSELADILKSGV
jgi:hypothetical protein